MRVGVVFHIHWWSRWQDVYTGGQVARLRAVAENHTVIPVQERRCRCGAHEYLPVTTPRRHLTDEQLDKLGLCGE